MNGLKSLNLDSSYSVWSKRTFKEKSDCHNKFSNCHLEARISDKSSARKYQNRNMYDEREKKFD